MSELSYSDRGRDGALTLDDAVPLVEQFKPEVRELYRKIPAEVIEEAKEIAVSILVAVAMRGSKQLVRMILDKVEDAIRE